MVYIKLIYITNYIKQSECDTKSCVNKCISQLHNFFIATLVSLYEMDRLKEIKFRKFFPELLVSFRIAQYNLYIVCVAGNFTIQLESVYVNVIEQ